MRITHLLIRRNEVIHIITFIRYATLKVLKVILYQEPSKLNTVWN